MPSFGHESAIRLCLQRLNQRGFKTAQIDKPVPDAIAVGQLFSHPQLFAIECLPGMSDTVRRKGVMYRDKGYDSTIFVFYDGNPLRIAYPKEWSHDFSDLIHEDLIGQLEIPIKKEKLE